MTLVAWLKTGETLGDRVMKVDHAGEQGAICVYRAQRWWARWRAPEMVAELDEFLKMLDDLAVLGKGNPIEQNPAYAWLLRLRALKNLNIIASAPSVFGDAHDFSPYGVEQRYAAGREAVRDYLLQHRERNGLQRGTSPDLAQAA